MEVLSQAFWTRAPSRFLAFTTTQQGITSKQLLVGMITDQVGGGGGGRKGVGHAGKQCKVADHPPKRILGMD